MASLDQIFQHYPEYRVLICRRCQYAIVPAQTQRHLHDHHPRLPVDRRNEIITEVRSLENLANTLTEVIYPGPHNAPLPELPLYFDGLRCTSRHPDGTECHYMCRDKYRMQEHCKQKHQWVNEQGRGGNVRTQQKHTPNKLWKCNCACQLFFRFGGWKRYFEVAAVRDHDTGDNRENSKSRFFQEQKNKAHQLQQDAKEATNRVEGFEAHRSSVLPWLRTTGIVDHMYGLKKDEIREAIALPAAGDESALSNILKQMDEILYEAHSWCFDGPQCMLTWQCRVVLSRFQSVQVEALGNTRAFDPFKGSGALKAYFKLARQFLVYMYRVVCGRKTHFSEGQEEGVNRPEDVMELNSDQMTTWQRICRAARHPETESSGFKDDLIGIWMLVISQHTGARRYRSPLVSFSAMHSIELSSGSWMEPNNFSSHLSGIIWVVQLLIFYDSARREMQGDGETLQLVKDFCERNMQQTVDTPLGEILRWRLLLFNVSKNTVGTHQATWDEHEEVLQYKGTELRMDHIPTLLVSEYRECQRFLYEDLMFSNATAHRIHAAALKDSMDVHVVGWNFCQHRDNQKVLSGSEHVLLSAIEKSALLSKLFLVEHIDGEGVLSWRENALASYERTVQEFLKRLAVLIHIEGGPPLRESEFYSMTWKNTQKQRSIFIHLQRVMIHTTYHKTQQQSGHLRDNIRFLSDPVAGLLLDYLVYVVPLRQIFSRHTSPTTLLSPYLWAKDEKVWPDNRLTRCLEGASDRAQIPRLHISNWRQMTVAIVKTKFASQIGLFEVDADDEDAEEMEQDIRILTKMRNHKVRTANRAYANQSGANFGNVWDGMIRMGHRASTLWQDFWGVNLILADKKRRAVDSTTSALTKRIAMGVYRPRKPWSSEALLGGLKDLYSSETVEWKSPEQEQALTLIMTWTEQVVAILPTGAGKSLLFMLPCCLPDAGITILVVPLVSLRGDLLRRLVDSNIEHIEWLPGERREAPLMIVSVEAAGTVDFRQYARSLINQQKLDRIVIDECHLTVTAASYRESMVDFTQIRELRTQFVYLTATLPPSIFAEFEERNYLVYPKVIRASSNRPNISYAVRKALVGHGSLIEQAAAEARKMQIRDDIFDRRRDKIILYVQTRDEANKLASVIGCAVYTARSGSVEEKQTIIDQWIASETESCIVATAALAEGFDYAHVRMVINVNEPDSVILFAQESGRAGRDGRPAYSLVLLPPNWMAMSVEESVHDAAHLPATRDTGLGKQRERRAMRRYLQGQQCFRTSLSEYLDEACHRRWCMLDDMPCAVCVKSHDESVPPRTIESKQVQGKDVSTGATAIYRARRTEHAELAKYMEDLAAVRGTCLLCRSSGRPWDHMFTQCERRFNVFQARDEARRRHQQRGHQWFQRFSACFWCWNPQNVCSRANPEACPAKEVCEDRDVVLPLCYGTFERMGGQRWLRERFGRVFEDRHDYMDWLGGESVFGGCKAVQAVRVAAEVLREF